MCILSTALDFLIILDGQFSSVVNIILAYKLFVRRDTVQNFIDDDDDDDKTSFVLGSCVIADDYD
jgi:hypothetical protein